MQLDIGIALLRVYQHIQLNLNATPDGAKSGRPRYVRFLAQGGRSGAASQGAMTIGQRNLDVL